MLQENLHLMLQEQRHKEHVREAENYRRLKELRAARGNPSLMQRVMRQFKDGLPQKKSTPIACCDAIVCETI